MLHLSEVLGLPVLAADGTRVGRVDDLRVDSQRGVVDRIVVRSRAGARSVAWSSVGSFSPEHRRIALVESGRLEPWNGPEPDSLCLRRDVLDRQIIDTQGR